MSHPLWLVGIVLCAFIASEYLTTLNFEPLESITTVSGVLLSIALWVRYSRLRSFDFLDPIHLVMSILLVAFCGLLVVDPSMHLTDSAEPKKALIVSVVATLAFVVGYTAFPNAARSRLLPRPLSLFRMLRRVPRPKAPALLLGLWVLTFFFRLFYSFVLGYGTISMSREAATAPAANLIESFGILGRYFLFAALIIWLSRSRRFGRIRIWLALACLALEVWIEVLGGWKYGPILLVVGVLLIVRARVSCGKRIGAGTVLAAVACLMLFLVVFYALGTARSNGRTSGFGITTLATTVGEADNASIQLSSERLIERVDYGGFLADVIGLVDSGVIHRKDGATLWPGFLWFIPRAIWPSKPTLSIGGWYAVKVLGWAPYGPQAAVTLPGDFYLNFGITGVLLGMLAYGVVLRLLYNRFVENGRTIVGLCLFIPIFMTFALTIERNLSDIIGEAGLLVGTLSLVLFVLSTKSPSGIQVAKRIR